MLRRLMKKFIFCVVLILTIGSMAFATDVNVQINGEKINFTDSEGNTVNAQIINDRTMVPMRKIFEILGANVSWDGENKIVKGVKDNIIIELQIDNNIATKTIGDVKEKIQLDTPPMLIENRTMVPLRFIAESLDKQVGWDKNQKTAIIIDYNYFAKTFNQKFPELYNFILNSSIDGNYKGSFTHNYYDLTNSTNDYNTTIIANVNSTGNIDGIGLSISGTSELAKEIISEGWNNTGFNVEYSNDKIELSASDEKLIKMFQNDESGMLKTYKELVLEGEANLSLSEMFRVWANVNEKDLTVNTFSLLKKDFEALCKLFSISRDATTSKAIYNSIINYGNYNTKYFDIAKLDNFVFDNEHDKTFNIVNKLFFKNDVLKDEMLYDNTSIKIRIEITNNSEMIINIEEQNQYSEQNKYIIKFENLHN